MASASNYILATAGHVDHGKSALIQALTGTHPSHLPDEKRRGITIDLGFAHLSLTTANRILSFGIIDVPGHEDFVKNMVAGVGSIDAALLVVAADDRWMPQTEEHLQILTYLGVERGVVALNKIDLATDEKSIIESIRGKLKDTFLATAPIVPTSTLSLRGMEELKTALTAILGQVPPPVDIGKPRLSIDRAFSLKGIGTVVTGTLTDGSLQRGRQLVVQPTGASVRARVLQTHKRDVETAEPGSRVAVNLPDLHPVNRRSGSANRPGDSITRGDVLTIAELGPATQMLDVLVSRCSRPQSLEKPLKSGTRLRLHHATSVVTARLRFFESTHLGPGQQSAARLFLESPIFALAGDRLVLRDWSQQHTLAGGIVLDPDPTKAPPTPARAAHPNDPAHYIIARLVRDGVAAGTELGRRSRFSNAQIAAATEKLVAVKSITRVGSLVIDAGLWQRISVQARNLIEEQHRSTPDRPGLLLNDLRTAVTAALPSAASELVAKFLQALMDDLCGKGFVRDTNIIRRANHRLALPARLQPAADKILQQLARSPLDPPSRKQLTPTDLAEQALRFLLANRQAVEIGPDLIFSAEAYQTAIAQIRSHLSSHGQATVTELKTALHSSRRIAVPLLEKLDRDRITLRKGDLRTLRS